MLVKKTNSEWKPSENMGLKVGDTIDITDPKRLILDKMCVAIGSDGETLDAFDLYDVVDPELVAEMREFKKVKHAEEIKKSLEAEKDDLEEALAELKAKNAKKTQILELDSMEWKALRQKAIDAKVFKPAMKKPEVIAALTALVS